MTPQSDFKFNDEFFLLDEDRKRLLNSFPRVSFAFLNPEARSVFVEFDLKAKEAKRRFNRAGIVTVLLALLALLLAAFDGMFAAWLAKLSGALPTLVAGVAALGGTAATVIGLTQLGIGERKREWLDARYICERLRQWQAQYVCSHADAIAAAAKDADREKQYLADRQTAFAQFRALHIDGIGAQRGVLEGFVHADAANTLFADNTFRQRIEHLEKQLVTDDDLVQLFSAYDAIRFGAQAGYTQYLLSRGRVRTHPRAQRLLFRNIEVVTISAIVALHLAVIIGVLFLPALKGTWVHFLVIASALVALSARVLEDGLNPEVHLRRLEEYMREISIARKLFQSADNPSEKLVQMRSLEEAAAREMFSFWRATNDARFVL